MAALTATEIARIRKVIGDSKPDTRSGYDLTDTEIQAEWDRADGHDSEEAEFLAYYYMLLMRRGIWLNAVDTQTDSGGKLQNQKLRNIERALEYYSKMAGRNTYVLPAVASQLDLDLDENEPDA